MANVLEDNWSYSIRKGETILSYNGDKTFAMHSVMKFPQALYVAQYLADKGISLDQCVMVEKKDLMADTWSPMLETFDQEKEFSYRELLALSIQQSDNNACDILFNQCGEPQKVEEYIKSLEINDISIKKTEKEMHDNPSTADENCCTSSSMVILLEWFYDHHNDNEYLQYIWDLMLNCKTGQDRIRAALPPGAQLVNKTGTGPRYYESYCETNDVGIVLMPDGTHIPIAIFIGRGTYSINIATIASRLLKSSNNDE
ncbi:MAG: serine hydrolase [Muribaculaceae bacterium]|nr:serine hydrolase [Muribaculaceae bacterium]